MVGIWEARLVASARTRSEVCRSSRVAGGDALFGLSDRDHVNIQITIEVTEMLNPLGVELKGIST
jgi:hypothetical protein